MRVAVVGAGLAGLAAACELADRGHAVTLFERRPWAGGKTYSFIDPDTGAHVDNGQHVFMACTTAYIAFLERLGTLHLTRRQKRLRVAVFDAQGRRSDLRALPLPPPLHLAASFLAYRHLGPRQKWQAARAIAAVRRVSPAERRALESVPFDAWLRAHGQSDATIRGLWDFLLLPTLNCRAEQASAGAALFVLQEGFLKSASAAAIGVPRTGLSALHVDPAVAYIEQRGGRLRTRSEVTRLDVADGRVTGLTLASGATETYDAYVCAVPHTRAAALLPTEVAAAPPFAALDAIPTAPIVNIHLWYDRPVATLRFAAFIGSELQWVFAPNPAYIVISLSGAEAYMPLDKAALLARFLPQVEAALPRARTATLLRSTVIKEPDATFVPAPGIIRPDVATPLPNLALAGAYTATGWPATMESAVRSGLAAARHTHTLDWGGRR